MIDPPDLETPNPWETLPIKNGVICLTDHIKEFGENPQEFWGMYQNLFRHGNSRMPFIARKEPNYQTGEPDYQIKVYAYLPRSQDFFDNPITHLRLWQEIGMPPKEKVVFCASFEGFNLPERDSTHKNPSWYYLDLGPVLQGHTVHIPVKPFSDHSPTNKAETALTKRLTGDDLSLLQELFSKIRITIKSYFPNTSSS